MNKNIIKNYALNLKEDDVKKYAYKEGVNISDNEANLFIDTVKNKIDDILDGKAFEVLETIKNKVSTNAYNKMHELIDKYGKYVK